MIDLSLVIPFYNEEPNVESVLTQVSNLLGSHGIKYEIIAVDNGSSDSTGRIIEASAKADPRIKLVLVRVNQGYGNGILEGLRSASGRYLGYIDGDGQINGNAVIGCYEQLQTNPEIALAKGVPRQIQRVFLRQLTSKVYNFIMTSLFRIEAIGINCKPKIFKRELYEKLKLESKDWFIDAEIMIKCTRLKAQYIEYPVRVFDRDKGVSKVSPETVMEFARNFFQYLFFKK